MREFLRRHRFLSVIFIVLALLLGWLMFPAPRGAAGALFHHAIGKYELKIYLPPNLIVEDWPWTRVYHVLLWKRYRVSVVYGDCDCVVTDPTKPCDDYAEGYNRISVYLLNRRFVHDIFEECMAEAQARYFQERGFPVRETKDMSGRYVLDKFATPVGADLTEKQKELASPAEISF